MTGIKLIRQWETQRTRSNSSLAPTRVVCMHGKINFGLQSLLHPLHILEGWRWQLALSELLFTFTWDSQVWSKCGVLILDNCMKTLNAQNGWARAHWSLPRCKKKLILMLQQIQPCACGTVRGRIKGADSWMQLLNSWYYPTPCTMDTFWLLSVSNV